MSRIVFSLKAFAIWLVCLQAAAASPSLLQSSAYWLDSSGRASLQDATNALFTSYQNPLTLGYTKQVAWLKLRIAGTPENSPLTLIVGPPFLRKIELYDPLLQQSGQLQPLVSGRATKLSHDSYQGIDLGFTLPSSPDSRDIYLRIETPTSLIADCQVLPINDAEHNNRTQVVLRSVYVGFLLLTIIWGIINWIIQKEHIYGFFAFRQCYSAIHTILYVGLFRYWLSDFFSTEMGDFLYCFVVVTLSLAVALFDLKLLREFGTSNRLRKFIGYLAFLSSISIALLLLGYTMEALRFNIMLVGILSLLVALLALTAKVDKTRPFGKLTQWLLKGGYVIQYSIVILPVLTFVSWFHASGLPLHLMIAQAAISSSLMMLLLAIRSRQLDLAFHDAMVQQRIAKAQLDLETNRRIEKESFLAILTHELRNPLSVIRLFTGGSSAVPDKTTRNGAVQKATNDMAQIIDRIEQSEKLDDNRIAVEKIHFDAVALLHEARLMQTAHERIGIDSDEALPIYADRNLLLSILNNFLNNALKYGKAATPIRLCCKTEVRSEQTGMLFTVINEVGDAGIPDPHKVFSKYYRSPGAHRAPGCGLGLYLIEHWAKAMGGVAEFSAMSGNEGQQLVAFSVWIPI